MNYAEILSRRLKKAGRDFAKGQAVNKKEQLQGVLHEIMQGRAGYGNVLSMDRSSPAIGNGRNGSAAFMCFLGTLCGGREYLCGNLPETLYGNL